MLPTKWPQWIIIPIGFVLAVVITGFGFGLVTALQASMPSGEAVPTPTPPVIQYAADLSTACTNCHTDQTKLSETAAGKEEIERLYIEPANTQVLHGRLGCVTCHRGIPDAEDVEAAHTNVIADPSIDLMADCLYCHHDLPNEYPDDLLIAPHSQVINGLAQDLACSDCHGSVGHGYDPVTGKKIISMAACLDCHEERKLKVQLENCEACHTEIPPWSPEVACSTCHSLKSYTYEQSLENSKLLAYPHAQEGLTCLDCHEQAALEQTHVGVAPGNKVPPLKVEDNFCLGCHVENEHSSYEQVAERTKDYVAPSGEQVNPHTVTVDRSNMKAPHDTGKGQVKCYECHQMHEKSKGIDYCYDCHHVGNFRPCSSCHEE